MATLATAYVQIEPTTKGIKGKLNNLLGNEVKGAGESSGNTFAGKFISTAKKVVAAAGIGKMVSSIISEGASYEQAVGGVETLFKESASIIKGYAADAYKSCGLSANAYMEQSTSFAASLISACGGNTKQAAEMANMALVDMSDNANKMGTDLTAIQYAYQGFAKQNYTMLDNLKLGYGGTKTEMERLLQDAEAIKAKQGEVAEYSIDSYADVVEAIHVVQSEMGITGTTAQEAATTISGSAGMVKGAWANMLTAISQNEGVGVAMSNLGTSVRIFVMDNLLPMVGNIAQSIPQMLGYGAEMFHNFAEGMRQSLPELIPVAMNALVNFTGSLRQNVGELVSAGLDLIMALADSLIQNIPVFIQTVPQIITNLAGLINDNAPKLLVCGIELIGKLAIGLIQAIPTLIANIPKIIQAIVSVFTAFNWLDLGKTVISKLWNGIKSVTSSGVSALKSLVSGGLEGIKSKFSSIFEGAKNIVKGAIEKIKGFFKFNWSLPKIKLPHFSISGKFSLNPPSIPHFSVSWYKKAMGEAVVLNKATLFGEAGGNLLGGGEAGREVISGESHLMDLIGASVGEVFDERLDMIYELLMNYLPECAKTRVAVPVKTLDRMMTSEMDRRQAAW